MIKLLKIMICCCIFVLFNTQNIYANNIVKPIYNLKDFLNFISNTYTSLRSAKLEANITLTENVLMPCINEKIDMNGYTITIAESNSMCIMSDSKNLNTYFYTKGNAPIFIVNGVLELYTGSLHSTGFGSLIQINDTGKLYTKNPIIENVFPSNNMEKQIGRHSIYDNQPLLLNIPNGVAINGGKESAYYHTNITAKTVIQSSIKPVFYYSSIISEQNVDVIQGTYNGTKTIKKIPIWQHQLVMAIDDLVTGDRIADFLPREIVTKDGQYITVSFDSLLFDESLSEQVLPGSYHNINPLYLDYLPPLEIKIIKNKKVPLSQFFITYSGVNCFNDVDFSRPVQMIARANYINIEDLEMELEYSQNIDFTNSKKIKVDTWGCDFSLNYNNRLSIMPNDVLYFRLYIPDGLQQGYSNIIKIDHLQMYYIAEPKSEWITEDENESILPPSSTDNDKTDIPETLPEDGSEHRNDASIDEPDNENEVIIKKDEISSNIKAEQDILVDLKEHQVTIPYETAKKYKNSDITVIENANNIEITSNQEKIDESTIQIQVQTNTKSNYYLGYIIVVGGVMVSVLYFFKYQRRVK